MEIQRELNLAKLLKQKSFFLFGPRGVGKSTLVRLQLPKALYIDLLESDHFLRFSHRPMDLGDVAELQKSSIIVIDEIQKIPSLLDEVHRLIEKKRWHFLLTGSSARKLKGNHINLLAGRAWRADLFPLSWRELSTRSFDLEKYLLLGGLPSVYTSKKPQEDLSAYVKTYLYEEIRNEALVRQIPSFSRFLETAALSNAQMLNFTEIGNDAGISPSTIREYYGVLEDTLMGFMLPAWTKSKKRKAIQTAKFYFFDTGVANALCRTKFLDRNSDLYGRSFEHFLVMEVKAYLSYSRLDETLSYWRSINGQEVDLLIGNETAIEIKATRKVSASDLKGLQALSEEKIIKRYYLVSQDPVAAKRGNVTCLPWTVFLEKLWGEEIVS